MAWCTVNRVLHKKIDNQYRLPYRTIAFYAKIDIPSLTVSYNRARTRSILVKVARRSESCEIVAMRTMHSLKDGKNTVRVR